MSRRRGRQRPPKPAPPPEPGPVPGSEILPPVPGEPVTGGRAPFSTPAEVEKLEGVYRQTVAGLRQLGHPAAADVLEREQFILYGDPDAPQPVGILGLPATLMGFPLRVARPEEFPSLGPGGVTFGPFELYDRRPR